MVDRVGESYELWKAGLTPESLDQKHYYLERFLEWKGISYEDLYLEYRKAYRSKDERKLQLWHAHFLNFYRSLRAEGKSSSYAKNFVSVIKSFLSASGLEVRFNESQTRQMRRTVEKPKDNFTKDEIRAVLASTPHPRNKALIMVAKDTGMAVSDISDLDIRDVKAALDNGDQFTSLDYTRNKTEVYGSPCLGYEALDSIRNWLRWRETNGYNCAPESPLFILLQERHTNDEAYLKKLKGGIRITPRAISMCLINCIKRSGINDKKLSAHCFRIFNQSSLESSGCNRNIIYRLQARTIGDSGRTYSKGELITSYKMHYKSLCVGEEPIVIQIPDERVGELEKDNIKLREEFYKLLEDVQKKFDTTPESDKYLKKS